MRDKKDSQKKENERLAQKSQRASETRIICLEMHDIRCRIKDSKCVRMVFSLCICICEQYIRAIKETSSIIYTSCPETIAFYVSKKMLQTRRNLRFLFCIKRRKKEKFYFSFLFLMIDLLSIFAFSLDLFLIQNTRTL